MGDVLDGTPRFEAARKRALDKLNVQLMLGMCPNERTLNLEHIGLPVDLIVTDTGCETSNWARMQDYPPADPESD